MCCEHDSLNPGELRPDLRMGEGRHLPIFFKKMWKYFGGRQVILRFGQKKAELGLKLPMKLSVLLAKIDRL